MSVVTPLPPKFPAAGPSSGHAKSNVLASPRGFDVIAAYQKAVGSEKMPHPVAAILALVELMEASTATTVTGLATELTFGRRMLIDTQRSLGVRAGCQLWERFFAVSAGGTDFPAYKKSLISQGRSFCTITAPQCRDKIAHLAVDFLSDDCTILTHSYSRTVISTILRAHKQHKRIKVYVTEARPSCLGLRTHQVLTANGIPCTVVLDSAVGYIMERVDLVLVGSEAVVESGGLVSSVGTYQVALVAKAMQKPFYALAESYKFLRHYPLSQTDLPLPRSANSNSNSNTPKADQPQIPLSFPASVVPPSHSHHPHSHHHHHQAQTPTPAHTHTHVDTTQTAPSTPPNGQHSDAAPGTIPGSGSGSGSGSSARLEMTREMEELNPMVDVTTPDLIDFIITDLGAPLSPAAVSQYLVAQFSS